MKKTILTGILALAAGAYCLMAQGAAPAGQQGAAQQGAAQQGAAPAAKKGPAPKSKAELEAIQALFTAQQAGPDAVIKAADDLLTKFADTDYKELGLYMQADAYQQKGDLTKAQVLAEQALATNPKSFQAAIMLAELITRQVKEHDLNLDSELNKAAKYANDAITDVQAAEKPNPQVTDEQWDEFKKGIVARAHNAIGMGDLTRKKFDAAATEFKTAAEQDPQPAYLVREASALQSGGKSAEAIALCDKILADPNLHPTIRNVATQIKNQASAAKK